MAELVQTVRDLKVEKDGALIPLSMSVASNRNGEIKSFEALFHDADMALYEAKQNGKNQIYVMN
ncbi:diguanylate cyclase [Sporosarcina saromensis]|uniref:Diguanylate cyclase n=1 Tax=Sporosarcina saromensis TaxID=359365 RepID=A0ABU4G668_9BACL|nr:diguanylate cyclase [Sporosarcina saromensis]MDW0112467.1 diguanylate cyclase [Sporosarcina saromensis]